MNNENDAAAATRDLFDHAKRAADHERYGYPNQQSRFAPAPYRAARLTSPGNARQALRDAMADPSKVLLGAGQGIPSAFVSKVLASARPGFVWIDAEHMVCGRAELYDCVQAVHHYSEGHTFAFVRVDQDDRIGLVTALDAGASAIIMPHTESAAEVREMVRRMYYAPVGERSWPPWVSVPGVSADSLYAADSLNIQTANKHVALMVQVESKKGIENLDEIAAVPGIAALMFGFGDYSIENGARELLGGPPHPAVAEAFGKVVAAGKKYGIPLFGAAQDPKMVPGFVKMGYAAVNVVMDTFMLSIQTKTTIDSTKEAIIQSLGAAGDGEEEKETVTVVRDTGDTVVNGAGAKA